MSTILTNEENISKSSFAQASTTKPTLPKRSNRRSLVGTPPQLLFETSSSPSVTCVPLVSSSSSMTTLPATWVESTKEEARAKRASTGMAPKQSNVQPVYIAPLKIGVKKYPMRPSTSSTIFTQSSPNTMSSPTFSSMTTPTMPTKSQHRRSADSAFATPMSSRSSVFKSHDVFVTGIGLDFSSPDLNYPVKSTSSSNNIAELSRAPLSVNMLKHKISSISTNACELKSTSTETSAVNPRSLHSSSNSESTVADTQSDTSAISSIANSPPANSVQIRAKSYDTACTASPRLPVAESAIQTPKRASLLSAIPMGISRSHQELIDGSPKTFHRVEAQGLFESVRGLMADIGAEVELSPKEQPTAPSNQQTTSKDKAIDDEDANGRYSDSERRDLRSWLATSQQIQNIGPTDTPIVDSGAKKTDNKVIFSTPKIQVAIAPTSSGESTADTVPVPQRRSSKQHGLALPEQSEAEANNGASSRSRLWNLLRAPSPTASASSYASTSSFVPNKSRAPPTNASTSSLVSNNSSSSFSLFTRKFGSRSVSDTQISSSTSTQEDTVPLRLTRNHIDEDHLASLIISNAEARHVLKTDTNPSKLREVGLKLELGWREQLSEAQSLRGRLELTQDTVEDLEEENKQLRAQLGGLSELVVQKEEDMKALSKGAKGQIARERDVVAAEIAAIRAHAELRIDRLEREKAEEKAFSLGLGMMLKERERGRERGLFGVQGYNQHGDEGSNVGEDDDGNGRDCENLSLTVPGVGRPNSVLFDLPTSIYDDDVMRIDGTPSPSFPKTLRRSALLQCRPTRSDWHEEPLEMAYEDLFRCSSHRFAQGAAAPPSTLVDERVLLIGTDMRLLVKIASRLTAMGLTQVILACPDSEGERETLEKGVRCMTFDIDAENAYGALLETATLKLGGEVDCIVNAFDDVKDVGRLNAVSSLLLQQMNYEQTMDRNASLITTKQPLSIVDVIYDHSPTQKGETDPDNAIRSMCTTSLVGLASSLATQANLSRQSDGSKRAIRLNSILASDKVSALDKEMEAILRLIDPCSTVQGSIIQPQPMMHCVGAPLCPALPASLSSPNLATPIQIERNKDLFSTPTNQGWLRFHKRLADADLFDALERENNALLAKVNSLEALVESIKAAQ
ncbi:uncharacterized protein MEPE_05106 [Melanopsichium pennsylvanicum]|uniref:Uncharacterized protein n=2 Tax=Melanopsichium pennsylvanicum TaxID=63383 RepID=A0AAJ4XR73_9BASI|nr:hypothetical protein BN887_04914 [Melanopsichium pennsylvanicum 4]SNX86397.1 uncharacterized protein MEPE_05106 [Melanopsichium pennsylvanicum]